MLVLREVVVLEGRREARLGSERKEEGRKAGRLEGRDRPRGLAGWARRLLARAPGVRVPVCVGRWVNVCVGV